MLRDARRPDDCFFIVSLSDHEVLTAMWPDNKFTTDSISEVSLSGI